MRRLLGGLMLLLLVAESAWGQSASRAPINAHHTFTMVSTVSVIARARLALRTYLGLINDSSAVVYCAVDDQTAVVNEGIRLAATGTTGDRIFFEHSVPQGRVACIAASGYNRILVIEGR